jgi:hypothetical protein
MKEYLILALIFLVLLAIYIKVDEPTTLDSEAVQADYAPRICEVWD